MKLEFDGNETFYELHGESGAPVVVLSHALAANRAMWQAQIDILQAHYRVLCYDIRGHGESGSPPEPYSLDDLADDAENLLDALGFDQVQWVGACLGGMIGQNLALRPSKRIAGLVLADTMATLIKEHRSTWSKRLSVAIGPDLQALQQLILADWFTASYRLREPQQLESSRRQIMSTTGAGYRGCCQAILEIDLLSRLRELDLPSLVVVGAEDAIAPITAALAMHERIAGSRLEILQSAAHLAVVEQSSQFNDILLEFLR